MSCNTMIASTPVFIMSNGFSPNTTVVLIEITDGHGLTREFCVTKWHYHSNGESARGGGHYFPVDAYENSYAAMLAAWKCFTELAQEVVQKGTLAHMQSRYIDHLNLDETLGKSNA